MSNTWVQKSLSSDLAFTNQSSTSSAATSSSNGQQLVSSRDAQRPERPEPIFTTTNRTAYRTAYRQTRRRPNKPRSIMAAVSTPGWTVVDGKIVPNQSKEFDTPTRETEKPAYRPRRRPNKPRSIMAAVSTPGWKVVDGEIVLDESVEFDDSASKDETSASRDKTSSSLDETLNSLDGASTSQDETNGDYELAPEHQESRWTRPTPPLPAAVASCILAISMKKHYRGAFEEVVKILRKAECPADLINESFVHWLFSIMRLPYWNLIDPSLSSRLCAAQLEDRIEYILRTEQSKQAKGRFDICKAAHGQQKVLASYVKRLCEREMDSRAARQYFICKQKDLRWGEKQEEAKCVYHHRANEARYKEPMSVSPEREKLPSIETDDLERLVRRQPSRLCRTSAVSYVDLTA